MYVPNIPPVFQIKVRLEPMAENLAPFFPPMPDEKFTGQQKSPGFCCPVKRQVGCASKSNFYRQSLGAP